MGVSFEGKITYTVLRRRSDGSSYNEKATEKFKFQVRSDLVFNPLHATTAVCTHQNEFFSLSRSLPPPIHYTTQEGPLAGNTDLGDVLDFKRVLDNDPKNAEKGRLALIPKSYKTWVRFARKVVEGVTKGLEALAKKGYTHNDIKPANIMLGLYAKDPNKTYTDADTVFEDRVLREVKVADFGLATRNNIKRNAGDTGDVKHACPSGTAPLLAGTPLYMAPEVKFNSKQCGPKGRSVQAAMVLFACVFWIAFVVCVIHD